LRTSLRRSGKSSDLRDEKLAAPSLSIVGETPTNEKIVRVEKDLSP